jgi:hypothetical protein
MPTPVNGLGYLGYSENGSADWTSLGAYAARMQVSGGDLQTGEFMSFDDDAFPYIGAGNFEPHELTVRLLYTGSTSEPYSVLRTLYLAKTPIYLRWTYGTGSVPYYKTDAASYLINVPLPEADSGSADPLAVEFKVKVADISRVES